MFLGPVELDNEGIETDTNEEGGHEDQADYVVDKVVVQRDWLEHLSGVVIPGQTVVVRVVPEQNHQNYHLDKNRPIRMLN